ncbi:MAG TPA: protein kinase [Gemmatimonadales bacterium]
MLERELGRGGMATVYLARDLRHDRPVALKVLHPELAHALGPERFIREIRLAARLDHLHIRSVHDSGEAAGRLWFTMPYVEGESLRNRVACEPQLSLTDAVRITRAVADALGYAQRQGIIHRDVKPENILGTLDRQEPDPIRHVPKTGEVVTDTGVPHEEDLSPPIDDDDHGAPKRDQLIGIAEQLNSSRDEACERAGIVGNSRQDNGQPSSPLGELLGGRCELGLDLAPAFQTRGRVERHQYARPTL